MTTSNPSPLPILLLAVTLVLAGAAPAQAQVLDRVAGLGGGQVPQIRMPRLPAIAPVPRVDRLLRDPLNVTRQLQIDRLLRDEPRRVDVDPQGAPVLRGEFLAFDVSPAQLGVLQALGFSVDHRSPADTLPGLDVVVLHDTDARSPRNAMRVLQQAAPEATFAYQHLFLPAGPDAIAGDDADSPIAPDPPAAAPRRIGLVDGGVDAADPALARADLQRQGCTKGATTTSRHGTAVAARLVNGDPDTLYAADLWCGDPVGGATSQLIDALAWMAREQVPVINISLVGPDNPALARAVRAMLARGHVLVSAVGNDGPAAPPLFPAAYPGVIGVSGVDARDRILVESGSGDQVDFSASGIVGTGRAALRGTSFAAPVVARLAAQLIDAPRAGAAAMVQQQLARQARDLGRPGRDPRYGDGLLGP
ncbi:MAG: S8 family serine peptidase [Luteimonas sp.]